MTLYEAIKVRHSVRAYQDRPVAAEAADALRIEIERINSETNLHIQLVLDEPKAFQSRLAKYGKFSNCSNYIVMAGRSCDNSDETIGYQGERLVLLAQTLGLNTCWVGLTYQKVPGAFTLADGEKVACVIALGYGDGQGIQHKGKTLEDISNAGAGKPEWFSKAVEAVLLAPTAVNQQKFRFELQDDMKTVKATALRSLVGYTKIDLGIAKCHFDLAVRAVEAESGTSIEYALL